MMVSHKYGTKTVNLFNYRHATFSCSSEMQVIDPPRATLIVNHCFSQLDMLMSGDLDSGFNTDSNYTFDLQFDLYHPNKSRAIDDVGAEWCKFNLLTKLLIFPPKFQSCRLQ